MRPHVLVAAVALAVAALPPDPAHAGTYKVQMCRLSDGTPAPVHGWHGLTAETCAAGGSFGVHWSGARGVGSSVTATLGVPANVAIVRADLWRHFRAPTSWQTAQPRVESSWEARGWRGGGYIGDEDTNAYNPAAPGNRLQISSPGSLLMSVQCHWNGDASPNACSEPTSYVAYKLDLTMSDGVAPVITQAPSGALLAGTWLTGATAPMSIGVSDVGSGAYRAFVRIGSTTRHARLNVDRASCVDGEPDAGTAYEFSELVPCATGATTYAPAFDLAAIGDGTHTGVTIGVEDAGGNERIALTGQTLRINAPGGTLPDAGTPCPNGAHDAAGMCQPSAPAATSDPRITGTAQVGSTLTTDDGTWNHVAGSTWAHGWQRCDAGGGDCRDIAGALGRAYGATTSDVGHRLRSKVTVATNGGTATAYSVPSPVVAAGGSAGGGTGGGAGGGGTVTPVTPSPSGGGDRRPSSSDTPPASSPAPAAPESAPAPVRRANGSDATGAATIALRANGSDRRDISIRYGREVVVEGRLTTPRGRPIAGATVDVVTTSRPGARAFAASPVVSDGDGAFRFVVGPGPSRVVRFGYRAHLDDADYAETAEVDVRVRTAARLRATPRRLRNGAAVRFRGRVAGAPRGSRKVVEMQVLQDGEWLTFATTRLRRGRFAHRYRFTRTTRRTAYRFRAVVRTEAGWPYETGASNRTRVVVRP